MGRWSLFSTSCTFFASTAALEKGQAMCDHCAALPYNTTVQKLMERANRHSQHQSHAGNQPHSSVRTPAQQAVQHQAAGALVRQAPGRFSGMKTRTPVTWLVLCMGGPRLLVVLHREGWLLGLTWVNQPAASAERLCSTAAAACWHQAERERPSRPTWSAWELCINNASTTQS